MPQPFQRLRALGRVPCARTVPGELSGGNWNGREGPAVRPRCRRGRELYLPCQRQLTSAPPGSCPEGGFALPPGSKVVTWLILPVVICLSQRLSHACLSISKLYGETANGSLNQLSFI